jgi:ribonuclease P protein component
MLKKAFRFHGHNSLNFVHSKGSKVRASFFQLKYTPNNRREDSRLAVIVSKKVAKSAPTRNRIRRRVYESVRAQWPMLKPGHDLVITVFEERVADIPADELNKSISGLLRKADLYKN